MRFELYRDSLSLFLSYTYTHTFPISSPPGARPVVRMTSFIYHTRHIYTRLVWLTSREFHEFLFFVSEVAWVKEGLVKGPDVEAEAGIVELSHRTHYRYCFVHSQEAGNKATLWGLIPPALFSASDNPHESSPSGKYIDWFYAARLRGVSANPINSQQSTVRNF